MWAASDEAGTLATGFALGVGAVLIVWVVIRSVMMARIPSRMDRLFPDPRLDIGLNERERRRTALTAQLDAIETYVASGHRKRIPWVRILAVPELRGLILTLPPPIAAIFVEDLLGVSHHTGIDDETMQWAGKMLGIETDGDVDPSSPTKGPASTSGPAAR